MTKAPSEKHRVQYNYDVFNQFPDQELAKLPVVTAQQLESQKQRPRSVRMLARDFVHDSLYNPTYGYFSRQAELLPRSLDSEDTHFQFNEMKNETAFMREVQLRYIQFEKRYQESRQARERAQNPGQPTLQEQIDALNRRQNRTAWGSAERLDLAQQKGKLLELQNRNSMSEMEVDTMAAGQVWHTPTQLFSPYYARAIARYLVAEYKLHLFPSHDLVIYELGGGAGTLARDILDYIREEEPEVYERTQYRIVEISARLASQQRKRLSKHLRGGAVEVILRDFLQWNETVDEPCYFVALEVLDNLAHDVVRYSTEDLQPYQCMVAIDHSGDFHELWEPVQDPIISDYLQLLQAVRPAKLPPGAPMYLAWFPDWLRVALSRHMPFYPNLTSPHYLPTGCLQMIDVLRTYFPQHRLVFSDFSSLPDAAPGVNAPVVQTRHNGNMIPVTTYLVLQGFFDIFYPTDFHVLRDIYLRKMGAELVKETKASPKPLQPLAPPKRTAQSLHTIYTGQQGASQPTAYGDYSTSFSGFFSSGVLPPLLPVSEQDARIMTHAEFLTQYAETNKTRLRDGSNPLLTWYANACWLIT
ncbi:hypothetical protein MPSI1_001416 [Malassezia psittaci]|uniref:Protein arginine methyltransferase NDUFAF7 n=1 Tax=Malassezia psittaci TaxID=1821823 RepID=A0AAF0JJR0_9BASI|nr:hypothetical protein MPSI1_001416 [Malassezia psittaci]